MSTSTSASTVQAAELRGTRSVPLGEQSTRWYSWYCCALTPQLRECTGLLWQAGALGCCEDLFMANGHRAGFSAQLAAASPCCSTPLLGRHLYRWWLHLFLFLWQLSELVDLTLFIFSWWPLKGCGSSFSGCVSIAQVSILLTLYQSTSCTSGFLRAVTRHFSDAVMLLSEVPMVAVSNPNKFVIKQKASLNRVDASLNLTKFQLIPLCAPSHFEFTVRHCKLQN